MTCNDGTLSVAFSYDPIGNRISTTNYTETGAAVVSKYAANSLNQYTSRTVPGYSAVRGHADANATVTVNEKPTYRYGEYFFGSDEFDNSSSPVNAALETVAVKSGVTEEDPDEIASVTNSVYLAKSPAEYEYDEDGNMTEDARFRYYWNGENRMIRAEEKIASSGRQPYVVTYAYDHMGRNVIKDGAKFIWDEYNIIVENAASSNAAFNTWGLDLDGTMQGAGGVGGLLAVEKGDAVYLPVCDANGNITEYLDGSGDVVAHYAYSTFGKQLLAEGEIGFTYRFSTKPHFPKTGLVEFEFRKYAPNAGRWMSRDPLHEDIETEFGSIDIGVALVEPYNQYCGLGNNPVRLIDADGLFAQYLPAAIKIGTELGRMAAAGVAAALATAAATEAVKKCPQPRCNPCDPPVGTQMYHFENGHDHHTFTRDIGHTHHFKVLQYPFPNCDCYLKRNSSKATGGYSPAPGEIELRYPTGGGPAL